MEVMVSGGHPIFTKQPIFWENMSDTDSIEFSCLLADLRQGFRAKGMW